MLKSRGESLNPRESKNPGDRGEKAEGAQFFALLTSPAKLNDGPIPEREKLGAFLPQWEVISSSQFISETVRKGYCLEFSRPPPRRLLVTELPRCVEKADALLGSLRELEDQNVVCRVPAEEVGGGFYSHVFVVRKPSGKYRLILNLKPLNQSVTYKRFRIESIFSVRALLPQNCYMALIDLRDAYLHIPIAEAFQKFLRLVVRVGEDTIHLQFQALPFCLSSSSQILGKAKAPCFFSLNRWEGALGVDALTQSWHFPMGI